MFFVGLLMVLSKHNQIVAAAKSAFEDKGYRVSMTDIAKRAGVAKQTLYNHFASKEVLFAAVTQDCTAEATMILANDRLTINDKIMQFSLALRHLAMTPQGVAKYRAMIAEAHQFPELAASFYQQGVGIVHQQLQCVLQRADIDGVLCCPDAGLAADMLFSMLTGFERSRLLLCSVLPSDGTDERVEGIVRAFLRAFAPLKKDE
jgi:TetR/AcrR family transcriptional repressor of mexJK operon